MASISPAIQDYRKPMSPILKQRLWPNWKYIPRSNVKTSAIPHDRKWYSSSLQVGSWNNLLTYPMKVLWENSTYLLQFPLSKHNDRDLHLSLILPKPFHSSRQANVSFLSLSQTITHSFNKNLLRTKYMPSTGLVSGAHWQKKQMWILPCKV